MIKCPECKSEEIYAEMHIIGRGSVNVNTLEVDDPYYFEAEYDELDNVEKYRCGKCSYEWYKYHKGMKLDY